MNKRPELQSLKDFVKTHAALVTMGAMRDWIYYSAQNGASMWIHRVGRRIFIDVDKFFQWTKRKI